MAIEKKAVEMPRRPPSSSRSSHSGGSKVVLGDGAGIAMNVSVSMDTAGAARAARSRLGLTASNSRVDGSKFSVIVCQSFGFG